MPKITIRELQQAKKEGRQLTETFTDDPREAKACQDAGIDMIVCMKDCLAAVRAAAPEVFVVAANEIRQPHIATPDQAVAAGFELMNMGADAVYSSMSLHAVEAMANERIPVIGHIGYVPYHSSWFGGARAVGKTAEEALSVFKAAKAYQDAGALAVEIEIVPAEVTAEIAKQLDIILISMGAGATGATVQYLFATDILGTNTGHVPRHAKVYGNLAEEESRVQALRVEAFKAFKADVASGRYPAEEHNLEIKAEEFGKFLNSLA